MSFEDTGRHLEATDQVLDRAKKLAKTGQLQDAEELCTNVLASVISLYGVRGLKTCSCLITLAEVNYAQRKYAEVITHLEQVLVTNESDNFLSDDEALGLYFKLAKSFERSGNSREACSTYLSLLKRSQDSQGVSASFTRKLLESIRSLTQRNPGAFQEAEATLERLSQFDSNMRLVNVSKLRTIAKDQSALQTAILDVKSLPRRGVTRAAMIAAACILCTWFLISGTLQDHPATNSASDATAALTPRTPGGLHMYAGTYTTTDGAKRLTLADEKSGIYYVYDREDKVSVTNNGAELDAKAKDRAYSFRTSGQALVDSDGAKLYRAGSPELKTVESMYHMAETLNVYHRNTGHYPHSRGEMNAVGQSLIYTNACTLKEAYPGLHQFANKGIQTIADYNSSSNVEAGIVAMSEQRNQPGGIELFALPMSLNGDSFIIRGYDRDGVLLPCSVSGRCFALNVIAGSIRR